MNSLSLFLSLLSLFLSLFYFLSFSRSLVPCPNYQVLSNVYRRLIGFSESVEEFFLSDKAVEQRQRFLLRARAKEGLAEHRCSGHDNLASENLERRHNWFLNHLSKVVTALEHLSASLHIESLKDALNAVPTTVWQRHARCVMCQDSVSFNGKTHDLCYDEDGDRDFIAPSQEAAVLLEEEDRALERLYAEEAEEDGDGEEQDCEDSDDWHPDDSDFD